MHPPPQKLDAISNINKIHNAIICESFTNSFVFFCVHSNTLSGWENKRKTGPVLETSFVLFGVFHKTPNVWGKLWTAIGPILNSDVENSVWFF